MKYILSLTLTLFAFHALSQDVVRREIAVRKGQKYLNLPVTNSNPLMQARLKAGDKILDQFTIKLADRDPDFWVFFDVTAYQGKKLTLELQRPTFNRPGSPPPETKPLPSLDLIYSDAQFAGQDSVYQERDRPQIHFSSMRGWINDPNGLIYYNGEYHLFYQHNPYGWDWGNMHWGHAVSTDLLHWKEVGEALYPVHERDAAFSGSAIYDPNNTSGFRKKGVDPLIAFYTSTGRGEAIQLSYDNGRTFVDYEANPILEHSGRDPKVFWYDKGKHWVMVVWDNGHKKKISQGQEAIINQHAIYTSPDLKNWTYQSGVEGFFECPELFELPVEGKTGVSKWVMYDATGRYVVGDFDGKRFTVEQHLTQYDFAGGYFYASQTFNDTPDGRRIQVGWGRNIKHPGMPFNQAMLFPTELTLKATASGYLLCPVPIREISSLHKNSQRVENKILKGAEPVQVRVQGDPVHVVAEFEKGDATFGLNVLGYELVYNDLLGEFTTAVNPNHNSGAEGPRAIFSGPSITPLTTTVYSKPGTEIFKLEVIVDKNIVEVFVNDGERYFAAPYDGTKTGIVEAFARGRGERKSILKRLDVHELKSVWNDAAVKASAK